VGGPYRIDMERPRSVRELLLATLALYRRYPLLFLILALAVVAPYDLAWLGITGYGPLVRLAHAHRALGWLDLLLHTLLIAALISALHLHAVVAIGEGERPRLRVVAMRGFAVLPVVGVAATLATAGIFVGTLALVLPGIVLYVRWGVVAQAAALEHERPTSAIQSSWQLTDGYFRHILGLQAVVVALAVGVTDGARALPVGSTSGAASVSLGIAVQTILWSFTALAYALLYFDLVARGRDLQQHEP